MSVLIVDDNRTVRRGIRLRLENARGIRVAGEASNGQDAVVLARAERVDVVLMDLHMPGMDGIEATRRIAAERGDRCRVVLLTSEVSDASSSKRSRRERAVTC
ncbi:MULTISPECIES: response regulator transcription factor [unclassified Microbacterium]|uniref:response regulator transcription factor n=1 Tax=unclassified Microbacterium TaxID=2609290 RepID=UPI00210D56F8|nr:MULTISPECIES: response regulator [unclassified Microbacterium]